eukprot:5008858-Pyramimonas_sp.AAC.1
MKAIQAVANTQGPAHKIGSWPNISQHDELMYRPYAGLCSEGLAGYNQLSRFLYPRRWVDGSGQTFHQSSPLQQCWPPAKQTKYRASQRNIVHALNSKPNPA